ncbi:beta-hexosaminidase [Rhodobacteraceae bacterium (ex Bugula neritina AB1)]|nr:beta-hexosaminidase [Rhodobacteraceae bacterium (ex Bugula neritina AB1)]
MTYGATILDAEGVRLTADEKAFFRDADPFGFILFARNLDTPGQIQALCSEFREAVGRNCLITIDQEGGRVQRLRKPLARNWRPPLEQVQLAGEDAVRSMYLRYRLIAHELNTLGIDSNCAPIADIVTMETHEFLKSRCYGTNAQTVARIARAVATAHLDGGVLPVLKHIPGHGRATADSHLDLPHVTSHPDDLEQSDFTAFAALNDLPLGMTAHLVYDAYDDRPATISPVMMQLIRAQIGFDGLIMTDDISMKALQGTPADNAAAAIAAGCDVVLYCNAPLEDRIRVAEAAGAMNAAAQTRADRALDARKPPVALDILGAERELAALMGGQVYG